MAGAGYAVHNPTDICVEPKQQFMPPPSLYTMSCLQTRKRTKPDLGHMPSYMPNIGEDGSHNCNNIVWPCCLLFFNLHTLVLMSVPQTLTTTKKQTTAHTHTDTTRTQTRTTQLLTGTLTQTRFHRGKPLN